MVKRDRDDASSGAAASDGTTSDALRALAGAVNHGAEGRAEAIEAEKRARAALVQQILAMPPKECFSPKALTAFKRKHIAMMARGQQQSKAPVPPQQPTKTPAPAQQHLQQPVKPPPPGMMMPQMPGVLPPGLGGLPPGALPKPPQ